jgi:hypothetical protein
MTGEEEKPEAIGLQKARLDVLVAKDDQLFSPESILGNPIRFGTCEIGNSIEYCRMARSLSQMQEGSFMGDDETAKQFGQPMEESAHMN